MTNTNHPRDYDELERNAAGAVEAIRTVTRLMRALAPVAAELRALQEAIVELQAAAQFETWPRLGRGAEAEPVPMAAVVAPTPLPEPEATPAREPEPPPPVLSRQAPGTPAEAPSSVVPFPLTRAESETQTAPAERASRMRTVTVTVSRAEGPLDLVRVHGALDAVEGISGLALASYTRGRAVILLDTDRSPDQLALDEALRAAFPEGVQARWLGPTEYLATIGTAETAPTP